MGENPFKRRGLAPVHGEPVGALHFEHPPSEPAPVPVRDPLSRVLAALLVAVHPGRGEGEVPKVRRESPLRRPVRRA